MSATIHTACWLAALIGHVDPWAADILLARVELALRLYSPGSMPC